MLGCFDVDVDEVFFWFLYFYVCGGVNDGIYFLCYVFCDFWVVKIIVFGVCVYFVEFGII